MSTALSAPQQQTIIPDLEDQGTTWKRQITERLDAYRSKHPETISQTPSPTHIAHDSRASRIARSVASRYAAAPTYRELLQAQAERAALAERIARETRIAEERRVQEEFAARQRDAEYARSMDAEDSANCLSDPDDPLSTEWTSALGEFSRRGLGGHIQPGTPVMPQFAERTREMHVHQDAPEPEPTLEDLWSSALVEPRAVLPSKLIEFPRELVSSRRARPRLPEIPESARAAEPQEASQLRIFEVHPEINPDEAAGLDALADSRSVASEVKIDAEVREPSAAHPFDDAMQNRSRGDHETALAVGKTAPAGMRAAVSLPTRSDSASRPSSHAPVARAFKNLEWAAISLDKEPAAATQRREHSVAEYVPFLVEAASIDRRLMAFAVDFAAVTAGFLGFLFVFAACTPHLPTGLTAIALSGVVYASLWLLYQMLFFSLGGATAGMLYARIALCTFDDQNPTRTALRRRLAAWWLSCLPLGIGFFWCFVDEDNLSWHDRMTGMYQRTY